jgi:signal transduction histidine kinase
MSLKVLRILAEAHAARDGPTPASRPSADRGAEKLPTLGRSLMRTRNWSIRSKIIALVTVPLVAFLALWIFATTLTAGPAFNLLHARTLVNEVGNPGIDLVGQLQRERLFSVEYLSGNGPVPKTLADQREATDRVAAVFRRTATGAAVLNAASEALRNRIAQITTELDSLEGNRAHIDRREVDAVGAQNFYNQVIDGAFEMFAACATFADESIDRELRALTTVGNGEEYLGRVDSLVAGATVSGSLNGDMRDEMLQDIGTARYLLTQGIDDMTATERTEWVQLSASNGFLQLNHMLDELVQGSKVDAAPPVPSSTFRPVYVSVGAQVRLFENQATDSLAHRATPLAVGVLVRLGLAAVLGLLALLISIIVSVKIGRSIVGRLRRLRAEAQEMADERLPAVVGRLQRGEAVDVDVETPPLEYGKDEIGQLGNAFNDVQRTAVQSAVEEAGVRRGINEVFLNIARRSQTLLHRQLALLDKMERRETEPQELEDLYRVDHLATRMRRHAEDLVILAGAAPGRGWRNPVPVIDVVRGAISEVEDYKRVDIRSVEQSAILGRAVGDVIHLLAELLENAASFSPPHTRVQVSGQVLPNGYAIEIEDRGLGMTPEAIDEANRRLLEPPDFDPSDSARLGLFVVAQLASRHGIRVSLRQSPYGGVTAIVLVGGELVVVGPGAPALPAGSTPPDQSWDRPLVGSGNDDPSRRSLADLQWQGSEELREVAISGRPVTINGTATPAPLADTGWEPLPSDAQPALGAGPSASTVAEELSVDGLVQRRRNRRPVDLGSDGRPPATPGGSAPAGPQDLAPTSIPIAPTSSSPLFPQALPETSGPPVPTSAAPMFAAPVSAPPSPGARRPTGTGTPDDAPAVTGDEVPEDGTNGLPSGVGWPTGIGSPAGLDLPSRFGTLADLEHSLGIGREAKAEGRESKVEGRESKVEGNGREPAVNASLNAPTVSLPAIVDLPARNRTTDGEKKAETKAESKPETKAGTKDDGPSTEDGLPRRVRQANLAPQLRRPAGAPQPEEDTQPLRSPEQIRSIMSALQHGTTRGRLDAAALESQPSPATTPQASGEQAKNGSEAPPEGASFADAATVSFPAIAHLAAAAEEETPGTGGDDAVDDRAAGSEPNEVTRPEKDAK